MTLLYADRVLETTTTEGTGTLTLAGAVTGYQTFVDGIGDGNTCYYCVTDGTDWEVGRGTVTYVFGGSDTLSRDSVLASSSNGSAVSWAAGTRNVFCTIPASRIQLVDPDADPYDWWMDSDATDAAISGGAARFTAPDKAHLTITDAAQTNLDAGTADFSVAVWFKPAAVSGTQGIVSKGGDDASSPGYEIWLDGTTCKGSMTADGVQYVATIGTVAASTWYLAVITADRNGNLTGYLNGAAGTPVDISSDDGQTASNSDDFYIGSRQGASWFGGDLCCVGFWDAVLTSGNVTSLWNNGNNLYHADLPAALTTDLISFWDMNEQLIDASNDCEDKQGANDLGFVAAELLSNTGFETAGAGGADVFGSWTEYTAGTSTVNDETGDVHAGSHACRLDIDALESGPFVEQIVCTSGNAYLVSAYAKSSVNGKEIGIFQGGTFIKRQAVTTSYVEYSQAFTSNGGELRFGRGTSAGTSLYYDDVSCKSSRLNTSNGPATAIASDVIGTNHATLMGRTAATSISDWRTDLPVPLQGTRKFSLYHDGTDDYEACGNLGNITALDFYVKQLVDNQELCTLANSTATAITVAAGVLTFGASLTASAIEIDEVAKNATEAGALLNDNAWHRVEITLTSVAASNFRIGTDSSAYGNIQVADWKIGTSNEWTFDDGPQGTPGQDSPIINWLSSEGSRYQFVQSTLSKCPSYDLSVLNSLPGIYFDGVDDFLTSTTTTILNSTEDTITIVGKLGASAFDADQVLLACSDTASANYYWELGIDSAGKFYCENKENDTADRVTGNTVMSPSDDFVLTITSDGFDYYMFVNRTAQTLTVTSGANTGEMPKDISGIDNTTLGAKVANTTTKFFEGHIIEILEEADWHGADDVNSIQAPTMKAYTIT